jgi:hypothetical protein
MDEDYQLTPQPVRNRSQKPLKLPGGFTLSEMGSVLGAFILTAVFGINGMPRLAILVVMIGYIKFLKDNLPDDFVLKFIRFQFRRHLIYRAGARDTTWAPPILRD